MQALAFYSILSLPIIAWAVIVIPTWFEAYRIPAACVYAIVVASPLIAGDVSVVGAVTPAILAGFVIALLPDSRHEIKFIAVGLAIISYLLYIHLSIFFSGNREALISQNFSDIAEPKTAILSLVSNVRATAIVIAASLLGFKLKTVT